MNFSRDPWLKGENPLFSCWQIRKIIEQSQKKVEISKNKICDSQLGMYDDAYQVRSGTDR